MDPNRWREIDRIFQEAIERDPDDRKRFLDAECGTDLAKRKEVEALLEAHIRAGSFLENDVLSSASDLSGRTLGVYRVESLLGKGGMGEVWKARDTKLGREVAIKTLPPEFAQDADRLSRFEREARLLASVNHPNIAVIHGLEESESTRFLVLELIEGQTLDERLESGPPPTESALKIALQIAEALEAAHEKGVIHRDLKPANIKVSPKGMIKVLDFGLAKAIAGNGPDLSQLPTALETMTKEGSIQGTPAYMSPEQVRGQSVDQQADVWAFGCVLFKILTGRTTFDGGTVSDILAAVLTREPEWERLPPDLPPRIRFLLERCLNKEPKDRYHSIADVRAEIQGVLATAMASPPQPDVPVTSTPLALRWLIVAGVAVLGIATFLITSYMSDEPLVLAVMPFRSQGLSEQDILFTEVLYQETVNGFNEVSSLDVIAAATMMQYADRTMTFAEIAREVRAAWLMDGTARGAGEDFVLTVELIDPETGVQIWSGTYEGDLTDFFAIQTEIAVRIASELDAELSPLEQARLIESESPEYLPEAVDFYIAAQSVDLDGRAESYQEAIRLLDRAVDVDPTFVNAWIERSSVRGIALVYLPDEELEEAKEEAINSALQAIDLDPNSGRAHAVLSQVSSVVGDWNGTHEAMERAVELGISRPQMPAYAIMQLAVGDFEGARNTLTAALDLNVMNSQGAGFLLAAHELSGDRDGRRALYERGEDLYRDWFGDIVELVLRLGEDDTDFVRQLTFAGSAISLIDTVGQRYLDEPEAGLEAIRALRQDDANFSPADLLNLAKWAAYFDDPEFSLELMRESLGRQQLNVWFVWLPLFDDVRQQEGFEDLLRELNLDDYWREHGWPAFCDPTDDDRFECA